MSEKTLAEAILEFEDPGPYIEVEAFVVDRGFDYDPDDRFDDSVVRSAERGYDEPDRFHAWLTTGDPIS